MLHCVIVNLFDYDGHFGKSEELELWDSTLEGLVHKDQEVLLKLLRTHKFHKELSVL